MLKFVCVLVALVTFCATLNLPPSFKKCKLRSGAFDQCLSTAIQDAIQQLKKPLPDYGLPSIEPFEAPKEVFLEYGNETTGIRQKYFNIKIGGFTKIEKTSARFNLERKILFLNITFSELLFSSGYEARGRFILYPIDVSTTVAMKIIKPTFKVVFNLEKYEKENTKYFRALDSFLDIVLDGMTYDFKNIFQEEVLNKEFNRGMNGKWQNIVGFLQATFPKFWITLFEQTFNNLLERVPASDLFVGL
ncbi:uncharacterized protein LOC135138733 [Zophobas morio]|uniref:uncharacterized protein LOC135138733 n=1 Tax=Zophobas morio TaxID=2755281 RepID=UPI003082E60C